MKNNRYLIISTLALGIFMMVQTKPAHAQEIDDAIDAAFNASQTAANAADEAIEDSAVGAPSGMPVADKAATVQQKSQSTLKKIMTQAEHVYNQAEKKIDRAETNAKHWMDNQVAKNMSDKQKAQINAAADREIAQKMADDAQKDMERAQKAASDADAKNQDSTLSSIQRNTPQQVECINKTAQLLSINNQINSIANSKAFLQDDINNIKNAPKAAATNATIADNMNKAINTPTDQTLLAYHPDENVVIQNCTSSDCYNKWVLQQEENRFRQSTGDKYPGNACSNPAMIAYRIQYAGWLAQRSKLRKIIAQTDVKVMYKYLDNYTQALNAYQTNVGKTASDAQTLIEGLYPNASKIGLTNREMNQAVYLSLVSKPHTETNGADERALAQAKAATELDEAQYSQHEMALDKIGAPPPVPQGALSTNGSCAVAK